MKDTPDAEVCDRLDQSGDAGLYHDIMRYHCYHIIYSISLIYICMNVFS